MDTGRHFAMGVLRSARSDYGSVGRFRWKARFTERQDKHCRDAPKVSESGTEAVSAWGVLGVLIGKGSHLFIRVASELKVGPPTTIT